MITFYKLRHATDVTKECYVGSTKNYPRRKSEHKSNCNTCTGKRYNFKVYQYIRANDGYDNWCFDVLEQQQTMSKRDKLIREGVLIEQHNATLNIHKAGASFVDAGVESKKRASMKYYSNRKHKEGYKQYSERYAIAYRNQNKEKYDRTLLTTKEKIVEYNKRRANTDNICDKCGSSYRGVGEKASHQRTKTCQRLAQQRIQPVINIDGDNNNVILHITVTV